MNSVKATAHTWYVCPSSEDGRREHPARCQFCDGGLGWCTVCGGGEAELTKDCPGRKMTGQERERVVQGRLNFVAGRWIIKGKGTDFIRCDLCKRETSAGEWAGGLCPNCKFKRKTK